MSRYRDVVLFFLLAGLWGGSFVAIEVGLEYYPPVLYAAYRFYLAAALLVTYVLLTESGPLPRTRGDAMAILFSGGLSVAANNTLLFVGQQYTTSGIAAITYSLVPIVTAAVAALWVGESSLDLRGSIGVVLAFLGVALVAQPDPANLAGGVTIGVALIFVGVIAVSIGSVGLRTVETSFSSVALTGWAMLFGAVVMHATSRGLGEGQRLPATELPAVVALVFLGIFSSALAYSIYFTLLGRLGAFQINLVSYVVPVVATVAGVVLLAEPVTAFTILGFLVIVAGFGLLKRHAIAEEVPKLAAKVGGLF
ncbi:DMT family transporter [Halorubrum vacuolatum]|uniref:Threonine/homoserine efflux transporter RhtA n=1 Tax=Halorubrum vacuolatum TaxID=63740 RepID=A0A238V975_HALVU|nr:DMT family transporter [Halorubrum vacuolatum]SNR30768.1 Threonine/homoserine efflux transporter RhtA [Halorubrum vacuolatum]